MRQETFLSIVRTVMCHCLSCCFSSHHCRMSLIHGLSECSLSLTVLPQVKSNCNNRGCIELHLLEQLELLLKGKEDIKVSSVCPLHGGMIKTGERSLPVQRYRLSYHLFSKRLTLSGHSGVFVPTHLGYQSFFP